MQKPAKDDMERESPLDVSPFNRAERRRKMRGWWVDYVSAMRFYTRIPIPDAIGGKHRKPDFARGSRAVPLVGLTVGLFALPIVILLSAMRLDPALVALLSISFLVFITGAFHEDGLADSADGLGGGQTKAKKLSIMKDSRLGTYGAITLLLATLMRVVAFSLILAATTPLRAALILIAAETLSRVSALGIAALLPPAREEGAAFASGKPDKEAMLFAALLTLIIMVVTAWSALGGFFPMLAIIIAGLAGTAIMAYLAKQQLGGQTGDIAGAAQQINLVAMLIVATLFI